MTDTPKKGREALSATRTSPLFSLPSELSDLADEARRFARSLLAANGAVGVPGRVNRALVRALGQAEFFALALGERTTLHDPRLADHPALTLCVLREAFARESPEMESALALQGLGGRPVLRAGSPAVLDRWAQAIINGDAVAAFALTEPEAGSDVAALGLAAQPDRGGFRLHGTKLWISNAPDAHVYTVFARTSPGPGVRGITAFAVEGGAEGLGGEPLEMLAAHPIGRLDFDGVWVSRDKVLGEVDAGFSVAMETLNLFRPSVGAFAVGMAQTALDAALEHADARQAFGGPLRKLQAVSHTLARMATRVHLSRLAVYEAAAYADTHGEADPVRSAMAKWTATENAQLVVDDAVQLHGAVALQRGHLLEHLYRDVRAPRIYEGASAVQLDIVGKGLYRKAGRHAHG